MLIVKGKTRKSALAYIMLNETYSRCFVYNDSPVINGAICLDSTEYSLEDFKECITEWHADDVYPDGYYDYLIIYTNQMEEELRDFIDWLDKNTLLLNYKDAIVMCK